MLNDNGVPNIRDTWKVTEASTDVRQVRNSTDRLQIVYVSIMGPIMLAAFLEWILWLVRFSANECLPN